MKMPGRVRFGKHNRLLQADEFVRVFRKGCRSADKLFAVYALANTEHRTRLGLVVGKRQIPLAVRRNRIKRLVRESFRLHQDELNGLDVVVKAQAGVDRNTNAEISESLLKHWQGLAKQCKRS